MKRIVSYKASSVWETCEIHVRAAGVVVRFRVYNKNYVYIIFNKLKCLSFIFVFIWGFLFKWYNLILGEETDKEQTTNKMSAEVILDIGIENGDGKGKIIQEITLYL